MYRSLVSQNVLFAIIIKIFFPNRIYFCRSIHILVAQWTCLVAQTVKHLLTMRETWVQAPGREDLWRRKWQPTPVLLPGKSHGWRRLVGYSPKSWTWLSNFTSLHFILRKHLKYFFSTTIFSSKDQGEMSLLLMLIIVKMSAPYKFSYWLRR